MSSVAEERINALVEGKPAVSYEELRLVDTLRALRQQPAVSEALRERVLERVADEPRRSWRERLPVFSWKGALLVAAPACLAVAVGGAVVAGLVSSGSPREPARRSAVGLAGSPARQQAKDKHWARTNAGSHTLTAPFYGRFGPAPVKSADRPGVALSQRVEKIPLAGGAATAASRQGALPPSQTRLQAYDAYLRLRVRNTNQLSTATKRAEGVARSLGGYVAFVDVATARQGDAELRLRVPVGSVQTAVSRLSGLGSILAQSFTVTDLQRQSNQQLSTMAQLQGRIGRLRLTLRDPALSPERRAQLQLVLSQLQHALRSNQVSHRATVRRGRLATITVTLTTRRAAVAVKHTQPGRIHRALSEAGSILARELAWTLYLLIVAAPLVLLAALVVVAARFVRRRSDRLVLERI